MAVKKDEPESNKPSADKDSSGPPDARTSKSPGPRTSKSPAPRTSAAPRSGIEPHGEVPKVGGGENEEDTATAIETPYAKAHEPEKSERPPADDEADDAGDEGDEDAAKAAKAASRTKTEPPAAPRHDERPSGPDPFGPWVVPVYVLSLALVFVGERILVGDDTLRIGFSAVGVIGAIGTTLYRLRAALRSRGEQQSAERTLAFLMLGGLVALAIYFSSTDTGKSVLHIAALRPETRARVAGITTVAWLVLVVLSVVPLVFGEIALAPMRRADRVEVRRVRAATFAGATLALAATYVTLFTYGAGEMEMKLDFSYFRTSRPGESTMKIVRSLPEPLTVTAFFPQLNEVGEEVRGYLSELAAASPNVQVKYEDRLLSPALAKDLKVQQDGVLVLQRGEGRETISIGADMKTPQTQTKLKSLDVDFQKALLKVIRTQRTAYFTVGHGELNEQTGAAAQDEGRTAKNLKKLVESQNYLVKDLGPTQGLAANVPDDAAMVFVLGPSQAFLPEEVASLKRYFEKGGRLVLALDPDFRADCAPLAAIAGLTWKNAVIATDDPKHFYPLRHNDSDHAILITNRFSSHAAVSSLSKISARTGVVFRGAAPLDKAEGTTANVDFAVRALTEAWVDENGNFTFDKETEKRGGGNLAAAVTKPTGEKDKDGKDKEMRAFVLGDADALTDGAVGDTPNGLMALDVIRWLGGDESFLGAVTSNEDVRIEHTKQKDTLWFYGMVFVIPLGVLGIGFVVTRRKRVGARRAAA
ncbi:MAG: Gldg family protein [Polyangiaceae bacterium]